MEKRRSKIFLPKFDSYIPFRKKKITFLFLIPLKILPSSSYVSIDVVVGDGDNCIGIGSFLVQSEDLCMYFDGSDLDLESNV